MDTKNKKLKLVTHNGSFHADDVFAAATLSLLLEKEEKEFEIIRTRDAEIIKDGDYVFDVGGIYDEKINRFDHHQKDFKEKRENGIVYSSFGLIWKKLGEEVSGSKKVAEILEKKLVQPVDAFDNGIELVENKTEISNYLIQHFFLSMCPTWKEGPQNMDRFFLESVKFAKNILQREIIQANDEILAEKEVVLIYENSEDKRIIVLDEVYPYENILNRYQEPIYVVYPRPNDQTFGVKSMRNDPKTFKNRKDFPQEWAGLKDEELQKVSGVTDAIFCHRGLFMAVAKTKEGAIKLAKLALE